MQSEHLQNIMSTIDDNKEKFSDETYLSLTNDLQKVFKEKHNKLYEITYLSTKFSRRGINHYYSSPKRFTKIIKITSAEVEELKSELRSTSNFAKACCNFVLVGISERLLDTTSNSVIGRVYSEAFDTGEEDDSVEIFINSQIVFTNCRKA